MLKIVTFLSDGIGSRHLLKPRGFLTRQVPSSHISTNTAINKSLRRSQYDTKTPERRRTSPFRSHDREIGPVRGPWDGKRTLGKQVNDFDAPRGRKSRPNRQQGLDIEDERDSRTISENQSTQRQLRKQLRRGDTGKYDRSIGRARYDYTINPESKRALPRAVEFGHKLEREKPTSLGSAIRGTAHRQAFYEDKPHDSEKDLYKRAPLDRTTRRTAAPYEEEQEYESSIPEELQDDGDTSIEPDKPRFSMGRNFGRQDRYEPSTPRTSRRFEYYGRVLAQDNEEQSPRHDLNVPVSIPYTTPASEFLYGTSVITAALLSSRRKLYKLYIYGGDNRVVHGQDQKIRELALKRGVVAERVKGDWLRLMDKMSAGRPHNGYILEASPLPKLPVTGFQAVEKRNGEFHVILGHQSREDEAVNGTGSIIKYDVTFPRYPFVLLLDGILDPGNLGAILRSAFFLGVDTVAISNRSSAPVSPVAIKASAGASETLPLVSVSQPGGFIDQCKRNGWKIYAAVAPTSGKRSGLGNYFSTSDLGSPVRNHPCLLILGGEGEGLHWNIQTKADFDVGIEGPRNGHGKVDSLNVSVAAGLLCEAFLRKPAGRWKMDMDEQVQEDNRVF
ncbi:hypothetical protein BDR22DRAFT_871877 [Usnea florida]